ncbi:bifunctional chorismate synthase/riboflavin reductase [NAD(P)H] aro2 [Coemansia spiralis]|uniref:Chorismate synthase n=2 Tax=Coemansia TaxID=4863 RepID=A0A9W8G4I9_9FUNG|nr:chorismate synthase [Coemansia spiralis]KAJ1989705.1 bifunctional chorismate synthase/riboflavin reductase [NAD(P)H] aro2 [Coemansia umbellata]KAJ2620514.1 bifunctional chorismate synthase/riboflavin reductase [NAD(P)H] aro2 [Coemansia sp. RSA 1358]KAJ2673396.1 bifunctional chorismate synthase/riboflavin reductase [NAD(P)H] aro2 [Coemansia spiralis]
MSTFGREYRVTTYGESHCKSVGCIVDGVPPGLALTAEDIQVQLTRRRPGQSNLTTPRDEKDRVEIQSGTEFGYTLGTPICLTVQNQDQRPHDYSETDHYPRPSHADWTYLQKYGVKASSGGGRSSARETIGRVAAGAIAEKFLREAYGIEIVAFVSSVGGVAMPRDRELETVHRVTRGEVDQTLVRCPDSATAAQMQDVILECSRDQNSTGGVVTCVVRRAPVGLGEPCFDKLEAVLAHAMLSIPATKGFEIGSGFLGTQMRGSEHNDMFEAAGTGLRTRTNHSGGIQGGISNGEDIYFRVAFKPPATISQDQTTASYAGGEGVLAARGRHDPCVVPRAVPIVEAMAALALMDMVLVQNGRTASRALLKPVPSELKGIKPI